MPQFEVRRRVLVQLNAFGVVLNWTTNQYLRRTSKLNQDRREPVIDCYRLGLVHLVQPMDRSRTGPQLPIFHPGLVLLCSLTGAALVGLYLIRNDHVRATVLDPAGTFQYFVPLMVPCFAFMIERVQNVRKATFFQHGVDFLVFALAVGRVVGGEVRYVSGHTLLLSYMLVSSRSWIVRISSIPVLVQTLLLKYYVWGDFVTSSVGLVLGCALALLVWRLSTDRRMRTRAAQ